MSRYPHPADMNPDSSDPRSPYYDSSREEWIEERMDTLVDQLEKDEQAVRDELGYFFTVGSEDALEDELLRFLLAYRSARTNEAMALAGHGLFKLLDGHVSAELLSRAQTQAEIDREKWEIEQSDMRAGL